MNESLSVSIGADPSGLYKGLSGSISAIQAFSSRAEAIGTKIESTLKRTFSGKQLEQLAQNASRIGGMLSLSLSAPLGALGAKAVSTAGDMDALRRGLATLERDAGSLQARLNILNEIAKLPGLGFKEAVEGDIKLRSVMKSVYGVDEAAKMSQRSMKAFGNALAIQGKGKADFSDVLYGLSQLAGTAKPLGEDLSIITERVSEAGNALDAAYGTRRSDQLAKMGITSKQVIETILAGLEKLPPATGGIKNTLENFADGITKRLDTLGMAIYKNLNLGAVADRITNWLERAANAFASLSPTVQKLAIGFGAVVVIVPPLVAALGSIATGILAIQAVATPVVLTVAGIAVAVGAAAALIIYHWDKIKAVLVNSGMWEGLKATVKTVVGYITEAFAVFANILQGDFDSAADHIKNAFGHMANGVIGIVSALVGAVGGMIAGLFDKINFTAAAGVTRGLTSGFQNWAKGYKFKVPPVSVPISGLFEGYSFGGQQPAKPKKAAPGGDKPKGKAVGEKASGDAYTDLMGLIDRLEAKKRAFLASAVTIPTSTIAQFQALGVPLQLAAEELKKVPESIEAPLRVAKQRAQEIDNIIKGINGNSLDFLDKVDLMRNFAGKARPEAAIFDQTKFSPEKLGAKIDVTGENKAQWAKDLDDLNKATSAGAKRIRQTLAAAFQELPIKISQTLSEAASAAFAGMGEVIGGLIAGTENINALPAMLLGTLGDMMVQLGKMAIQIGVAMEAIKLSFETLGGVGAIAAGVLLIALGSVAKSGAASIGKGARPFANGGMVSGPTYALIGEGAGTGANNRELVAPLNKFWPELNKAVAQNSVGGYGPTVTKTRLRGDELILVTERAARNRKLI